MWMCIKQLIFHILTLKNNSSSVISIKGLFICLNNSFIEATINFDHKLHSDRFDDEGLWYSRATTYLLKERQNKKYHTFYCDTSCLHVFFCCRQLTKIQKKKTCKNQPSQQKFASSYYVRAFWNETKKKRKKLHDKLHSYTSVWFNFKRFQTQPVPVFIYFPQVCKGMLAGRRQKR